MSKKSKIESVGQLFIETRLGDWFQTDRKIISELIESQKFDDIRCIFSSPNYPFDNAIKQMEEYGIRVTIAPVGISCNISDTIIFYYRIGGFDREGDNAIRIKGRVGKKLAKELKEAFIKQFSSAINVPIINKRYRFFLTQTSQTPEEFNHIRELLFEKDLEVWEKIVLYTYLSPISNARYPSIKSINKLFGEDKNIEKIIEQLKNAKIIEYIYGPKDEIKLKLSDYAIHNYIPRFMISIFNNKKIMFNNPQIGKIVSRYKLRWKDFGFDFEEKIIRL